MVTLPGTHKLKTLCCLVVGDHALRVEAFVMRQPDENRERAVGLLLQRNARMYGVAFAIDRRRRRLPGRPAAAGTRSPRTRSTGCSAPC